MNVEEYEKLWTTNDLERVFRVTFMTIWNWRIGKFKSMEPLPTLRIPGATQDAIRFRPRDIIAWAEKHGRTIHEQP